MRNSVALCSENKTAAYLYAAFSFFLVEPWGDRTPDL
jgi:hypothetical protein